MDEQQEFTPNITQEIDTNAEYISTSGTQSQPPIITSVFKSIFVEIPGNFFRGIINFFRWLINLFRDGFKYLRYPSLKLDPFATKDYKESCRHTFEFALLVTGILIFLIKLDWIPAQKQLQAVYNNDLSQAGFQLFIFLSFAISYFILVILAVLAGRFYRLVFKIPITRQESDILFTYLNNTLYIITGVIALVLRCALSYPDVQENFYEDIFSAVVVILYILIFGILIYKWARRFVKLNNVDVRKQKAFIITVTILTSIFLGYCSSIVTFFILGV